MSTKHKTSATPLGMTFLFLSLALVPVSMKVAGFNPNLSAVVDAWNRIVGVFGGGYQPVSTTELLALNQSNLEELSAPSCETACRQGLLASLEEPVAGQADAIEFSVAAQECDKARAQCCSKATKRAVAHKRVETAPAHKASAAGKEFRVVAFEVQEMNRIEVANREEVLRQIQRRAALREIDLSKIMKNLPMPKAVNLFLKMKPLAVPSVPSITRCSTGSAPKPAAESEVRSRTLRARYAGAPDAEPDNCDL